MSTLTDTNEEWSIKNRSENAVPYEGQSKKAGVKQGSLGVLAMNEKGAQGWAGQRRPLLIREVFK